MANIKTGLLTATELRDLYGIPVLNDLERQQYFTFDQDELNALNNFRNIKDAVYFAVFLVFFKLKRAIIQFQYRDITLERKHVMERYFPNKAYPKSLPSISSKNRINFQIIELCHYKYCKDSTYKFIQLELQELASYSPRQRQLLKDLLRLLEKHRVIIPEHTPLLNLVIQTWNKEQNRIEKCYLNSTTLKQRKSILALLKTTAETTDIHDVKADLKSFKTHDLWEKIKKHTHLKAIFEVAKIAIQKMGLPLSTCQYYASLVQYYHASRMKRINKRKIGLYLLCYVFIRYQTINDTLIDGFKKRISDIQGKANSFADEQRLKQLDASQETRQNICNMMLMVKKRRSSKIDKKILYKYIAEAEWEEVAYSLVDENFNKKCLYWQYIDSIEDSIKLSIRPLFLALDFTIIQNDLLKEVMDFMKSKIESSTLITSPFPKTFHKWVDKNQAIHIFQGDEIISNRFEFLMYMKMIQALSKNQISLEHSMRYKNIDDEIMKPPIWQRNKKEILKKLDYPKLSNPMEQTLTEKCTELTCLYKTVNDAISRGENKSVIIKNNKKGERVWSLRRIEAILEPNDSLFAQIRQHSIVEIIQFVNQETNFIRAFEPILPKGTRSPPTLEYLSAVVLANAIRMGARKMSDSSDLNESKLLTTEANYVSIENLRQATDLINNATAKFEIFEKWYIDSIIHGTLDALKLDLTLEHSKGRHSSKYFGCGLGVASHNHIINGLSVTGKFDRCPRI